MGEDNSYWIGPKENNVQISSMSFKNQDIFNKYKLSFYNCDFQTPISLSATFTKPIQFIRCRFIKEVSIEATFNESISFVQSSFESITNFDKSQFLAKSINTFSNTIFKKRFSLSNAIFKTRVSFKQSTFDDHAYFVSTKFFDVDFQDSHFKTRVFFSKSVFNDDSTFNETTFNGDARFDVVTFMNQADFCRCQFDKSAYFYETVFKKFPNFVQTIFDGSINFTNTELDFNYGDIENKIRETYKEKLKYYNEESGEHYPQLHKIANEFRDVFRNIKNLLIEYRNMLDASNYHRVELYCKELELKYKKEKSIRDVADRIQLYCYRVTSEHHTDLMLILNNVVFLIVLFGIINLGLEIYAANITIESMITKISGKTLETLISATILIILVICFMFGSYKKLNCYILSIAICTIIVCAYFPALAFVIASLCCVVLLLLVIFACVLHCCYKMCVSEIKQCAFIASYPMVTTMLIFKPKQLMPIIGKLIDNKDSCCCCDDFNIFEIYLNMTSFPSETLNLIYMLFLFLLLWSLQKTARKNTIVPN